MQRRLPFPASDALWGKGGWMQFYMSSLPYLISPFPFVKRPQFEREILRDRVKAGIAQARKRGKPHGRPPTVKACSAEIKLLFARALSKREIARRLKIGRTSVRRILAQKTQVLSR
jgi:hypothetical protein